MSCSLISSFALIALIFSFSSRICSLVFAISIFNCSSAVGFAASACGIVNNIPIKLRIIGSVVMLIGSVAVALVMIVSSNSCSNSDNNSKEFSSSSSSFAKTSYSS